MVNKKVQKVATWSGCTVLAVVLANWSPALACQGNVCPGGASTSSMTNSTNYDTQNSQYSATNASPTAVAGNTAVLNKWGDANQSQFRGLSRTPDGAEIRNEVVCPEASIEGAISPSNSFGGGVSIFGTLAFSVPIKSFSCGEIVRLTTCHQVFYSWGEGGDFYKNNCGKYAFGRPPASAVVGRREPSSPRPLSAEQGDSSVPSGPPPSVRQLY